MGLTTGFARTCAGAQGRATAADVLPEDLWQKIQHRIAHR